MSAPALAPGSLCFARAADEAAEFAAALKPAELLFIPAGVP